MSNAGASLELPVIVPLSNGTSLDAAVDVADSLNVASNAVDEASPESRDGLEEGVALDAVGSKVDAAPPTVFMTAPTVGKEAVDELPGETAVEVAPGSVRAFSTSVDVAWLEPTPASTVLEEPQCFSA